MQNQDSPIALITRRTERRDIARLYSAGGMYLYDLNPDRNQFFCETPAAWELWDETDLLQRVRRWPKKRIGFVIPKGDAGQTESANPCEEQQPNQRRGALYA